MAQHKEFEDELSQKDHPKTWRAIWNWRSSGTSDLSTKTPNNLEDSQCIPCYPFVTLYQKWSIWEQLSQTVTWITRRRRSIWSRNDPQTSEKRKRISILCEIERISDHRSDMGIWISFLEWQRHATNVQRKTSTMKHERISPYWTIRTTENPKQETGIHIYTRQMTIDPSAKTSPCIETDDYLINPPLKHYGQQHWERHC